MPTLAKHPCAAPGCPALVAAGQTYCLAHRRARYYAQNHGQGRRVPRMPRGWRKLRAQVLREEPFCRACGAPATEVDHILPRALGGTDDRENLQALCKRCHSAKTMRELNAARGEGGRNLSRAALELRESTRLHAPSGRNAGGE